MSHNDAIPKLQLTDLPIGHRAAIDNLVEKFLAEFGPTTDGPDFVARAPGRVNLIGEHIDYCGFSVLPMAIDRHVLIAAGIAKSSGQPATLRIHHANPAEYPSVDVAMDADGVHVDVVGGRPLWHQYLLCGFRGVQDHMLKLQGGFRPVGLNLMVDGDIPPGAGLSSSSAMVVCASLVAMWSHGMPDIGKRGMASLCAAAERHIGTDGGGMDQAISLCGEVGRALWIDFKSGLDTRPVTLPSGYSWVVAHCGRVMNKAATDEFNQRVAECRLAAALIRGGVHGSLRLADAIDVASPGGAIDALDIVDKRLRADPSNYTLADVAKELPEADVETVAAACVTSEAARRLAGFQLRRRAQHVFGEARRVLEFRDACATLASAGGVDSDDAVAARLGGLMNDSHDSCSRLYECSCPELDRLCRLCREVGGALGSRLTGAGWGGCCVSLVPDRRVPEFLQTVEAAFADESVAEERRPFLAFASAPGCGAYVVPLRMGAH